MLEPGVEVVFAVGGCGGDADNESVELSEIAAVVLNCVEDYESGCAEVVHVCLMMVSYGLEHAGVQQCEPENCRSWPGIADGPRPSVED